MLSSVDSAPSLGVYYFLSLTLVCLYVCHAPSNQFFFCFSMESSHFFGHQFSMWHSTKRCSSIFALGPLTPKIYSPKFGTKSSISRLVWQIDRKCLGLLGGFREWRIHCNHAKCCGADPCCHGKEIWARHGVQSPTGLWQLLVGIFLFSAVL